jgi:hypothetical protein
MMMPAPCSINRSLSTSVNQIPLRAVVYGHPEVELFGKAERGEDVVRAVRVDLHGQFTVDHRQSASMAMSRSGLSSSLACLSDIRLRRSWWSETTRRLAIRVVGATFFSL